MSVLPLETITLPPLGAGDHATVYIRTGDWKDDRASVVRIDDDAADRGTLGRGEWAYLARVSEQRSARLLQAVA